MPVVGLHCSHEQIPPSRLLGHVRHAEAAGFGAIMSSDHFSPWSERQGESGFAWSWLGAAMGATALPFGVVNAPGQRYHPAIVAQAAATLCEMFPGRLWIARWAGEWADGLATVNQPRAKLEEMIDAFRSNGGEGKRLVLQVHLSWAPSEEEALRIAHDQWRTNVFPPPTCWDLELPEEFDRLARDVTPEQVRDTVLVSADLARHTAWLEEFAALGFDEINLHHVGKDLSAFIDAFGEHVLPRLAS